MKPTRGKHTLRIFFLRPCDAFSRDHAHDWDLCPGPIASQPMRTAGTYAPAQAQADPCAQLGPMPQSKRKLTGSCARHGSARTHALGWDLCHNPSASRPGVATWPETTPRTHACFSRGYAIMRLNLFSTSSTQCASVCNACEPGGVRGGSGWR